MDKLNINAKTYKLDYITVKELAMMFMPLAKNYIRLQQEKRPIIPLICAGGHSDYPIVTPMKELISPVDGIAFVWGYCSECKTFYYWSSAEETWVDVPSLLGEAEEVFPRNPNNYDPTLS